jgi:hypothetical protein
MGRSLWIMDNVTTLQQLAAAPAQTTTLFQPRETLRYRHSTNVGGNGEPEYPAPGVHVDMHFAAAPGADTRLEILDGKGEVIRSFGLGKPSPSSGGQEMRGPFRGAGTSNAIRPEAGMQRFTWDMRHPGPWTAAAPQGGGGGPMVPPGKYSVRLTTGGQAQTKGFELKVDPRVTADGVTQTDLEEQAAFLLRVRDAISDARRLQQQIEAAMKKSGIAPVPPAVPGSTPAQLKLQPLQALWARVADQGGIYPQPMLISQFNNVNRMAGQADQKVGKDAHDRFNDLLKELQALQAEFKQVSGSTQ